MIPYQSRPSESACGQAPFPAVLRALENDKSVSRSTERGKERERETYMDREIDLDVCMHAERERRRGA